MPGKDKHIHIRIDPSTLAQLRRLVAQQPEGTMSSVIRMLIRKAAQEAQSS